MKVLNSYELQDKGSVMKTIVRTKKEKVTWKEFFQVVMAIAFPIAIQNLLGTTASMVDTIYDRKPGRACCGSSRNLLTDQFPLFQLLLGICEWISVIFLPVLGCKG